jgi:hypothetical protein
MVALVDHTIVTMAKQRGHDVVFTPPHHSDLQPIETVWAIVKGAVGRQYTSGTTFKDVGLRLQTAFNEMRSKRIYGCIAASINKLKKLDSYLQQLEQESESNVDAHDEDESGESSNDESSCESS